MQSNRREGLRIDKLTEDLELRKVRCAEYQWVSYNFSLFQHQHVYLISRASFFEVLWLFGPLVCMIIVDRCSKRDQRLIMEAEAVIAKSVADKDQESKTEIVLKTHLELQTVLCTEYRYVCFELRSNRELIPLKKFLLYCHQFHRHHRV